MFLLVSADVVRLWTSALFMLVVGMGNAVNMTSQRLMIHDQVGASYGPTAMAVEPLLSGGASMIASFGAGVLVDFVGHAAMFGVLGALALGCVVLTLRVPRSAALTGRAGTSGGQAIRPKRLVQTMPAVAVLIAVTITTNLCVLGYQPLVPKLAERFSSSATLAGSLTAAAGFGQLLGGVVIAARVTRHRLVLLLAGSATTILGIAVFGLAECGSRLRRALRRGPRPVRVLRDAERPGRRATGSGRTPRGAGHRHHRGRCHAGGHGDHRRGGRVARRTRRRPAGEPERARRARHGGRPRAAGRPPEPP
jgi:hypothetical protein